MRSTRCRLRCPTHSALTVAQRERDSGQRGGDGLGTESLRPIVKSGGRPSRLTHERRGPPTVSVGRRVFLQTVLCCVGPSANVHFTAIAAAAEGDCEGRKEHLRHRPTDRRDPPNPRPTRNAVNIQATPLRTRMDGLGVDDGLDGRPRQTCTNDVC